MGNYLLIISILFICGSCRKDPASLNGSQEIIISDNTISVNEEVDFQLTSITDNSLQITYSSNESNVEIGDILVGYNDTTAYLRKIISVSVSDTNS